MRINRRILMTMAGAAALTSTLFTGVAHAWEPTKPIDFVIMAGAGGGADQIARFIQSVAEKKDLTVRPLVPNNKGGGSGAEALIALKGTSDPDHTLLVTLNSFFTTPLRQENLGVDIETFTPIAMMGVDPFVLWVHKDSGITTFEDWLAKVKSEDGQYVMGGTGKGQEDSIVIAWLEKNFDVKIKYIPYKGGGEVAKELAGQQISASVNNPAEARGFFQSGDVVPLVAFSDERLPALPDVPTVKELDKDFSYYNQRAVVGAPGMSDEAAEYYRDLFQKIYDSEEWQEYMKSESLEGLPMNAEEQKKYWTTQVDRHKELLAEMGE
ncbi:Bug family tripartite tricarboxylate transporter substrate binding protein [Aurantimonas marianensis]|uniref:Tripartite tricarboxylate transporter substrate binding protein n=1 Tax=Aurantimonas marianensis TaxID=2920428 RepID=A0A9X2H4W2_9HYPH|nr:tripartite tricarboxylate transporter substrate binding protein [Aurantimonas marianensis]MCP3055680.1 tripartite tricarboxylate transporter substrate binding protein [Aurantimonas marianensis]